MTDPGNRPAGLNWIDRSACAGTDPTVFLVPRNYKRIGSVLYKAEPAMTKARAICATCPVGAECEADGAGDLWSVRNGKTPNERSVTPAASTPVECGTEGGAKRHRRQQERPCAACRKAENLARKIRKDRSRDVA